ncbi:MAG: 50S ribosomal protein L24 [Erysipelotrichaceae bacterium]|jgi:large subunit ribosomal protein L24|nr:50S ribosomal protein L24 [Erysipelotrichaceae bacterium]MBR2701252.1 50S ribosomal protein L24 [Erysipelotrichaceae bacterium]MBR2746463.1 50S ribosomal protein L24 [Erysipelotrichaceae bacterium]
MKIKKGDRVIVIAGKDKGVTGDVIATFEKTNQVVVEGVNIRKKALRPTQINPDGGIQSQEAPIDASNVMLYDAKTKKAARIGYAVSGDKKVRINKKTGKEIKADKKKR